MSDPVILLAAGESSRLGMPKGHFPFRGRTWLEWQCDRFGEAEIRNVLLIVGKVGVYDSLVQKVKSSRIQTILNPDSSRGPFSSVLTGLAKSKGPVFLLPIDVPVPSRAVWSALPQKSALASIPEFHKRGGHPVWLSSSFAEKLKRLDMRSPEARLDRQLHLLAEGELARIEVDDPLILGNLNTEEEFKLLEKSLG